MNVFSECIFSHNRVLFQINDIKNIHILPTEISKKYKYLAGFENLRTYFVEIHLHLIFLDSMTFFMRLNCSNLKHFQTNLVGLYIIMYSCTFTWQGYLRFSEHLLPVLAALFPEEPEQPGPVKISGTSKIGLSFIPKPTNLLIWMIDLQTDGLDLQKLLNSQQDHWTWLLSIFHIFILIPQKQGIL